MRYKTITNFLKWIALTIELFISCKANGNYNYTTGQTAIWERRTRALCWDSIFK